MSERLPLLGVSTAAFRAGTVLLVERGRPPLAGLLSLPGGRVRFGERLEAAARRELLEETGYAAPTLRFHGLHEAIDEATGLHAVIAVHRAAIELPAAFVPRAGDDARAAAFHALADLAGLAAAGRLTPGLAAIVDDAHRSHRLGL